MMVGKVIGAEKICSTGAEKVNSFLIILSLNRIFKSTFRNNLLLVGFTGN